LRRSSGASREKGKQGVPGTVARVLNLALQYDEVRPSLLRIARLACACKQAVVNCLKLLSLCRFVIVHRRIKRIRTALGRWPSGRTAMGPSLSVNSARAFVPNRPPTLRLTEYVERPDS
jgi:hypothetical protein